MNGEMHNGRSFASILTDTKQELMEFLDTRITMLKAEMREKTAMLKTAAPLAIVGLVMLCTAYMLLTLALVGLIVAFLPTNPFRWAIAFAAVAVLWSIIGGVAAYFAKRQFEGRELMPSRTLGVLKQDKVWLQAEVKNQI